MIFLFICLFAVTISHAIERRTLYEKVAVPDLIIYGTVLEDDQKYALVSVEEVLKGAFQKPSINVSFRKENLERQQREEKIEFTRGDKVILLLEPFRTDSGRVKSDLFTITGRDEGMIRVSAESATLTIEAIRRFVKIQSIKEQKRIWEGQKALLKETNRLMVEAGLQEIIKFWIAEPDMIPLLLEFIRGENLQFRLSAAKIFCQLFEDETRKRARIEGREEVIRELIQKARGDASPSVRVETIKALKRAGNVGLRDIFEAISKGDEDQEVRYEAQKALYEIRSYDNEEE